MHSYMFPPIEVLGDPQMNSDQLTHISEIPDEMLITQMTQEFRRYLASMFLGRLKGFLQEFDEEDRSGPHRSINDMSPDDLEHFAAADARANPRHKLFRSGSIDPQGCLHDRVVNRLPAYGISPTEDLFTLYRRFDPVASPDPRFDEWVKGFELNRPMTEGERIPAVLRSFRNTEDYVSRSHAVFGEPNAGGHTLDGKRIIYIGGISVENFPMQERVYEEVAASDYARKGPFEFEVLSPQDGSVFPPLLSGRLKADDSGVLAW